MENQAQPQQPQVQQVQVEALLQRLEAAVKSAEEGSAKANSESGFAFNAKKVSEEHATAISQIKGTVEADVGWLSTTKVAAEEASKAIAAAKGAADADSRFIATSKAQTEKQATEAKINSDRIAQVLPEVEANRTQVSGAVTSINAAIAEIGERKAAIEASATTVNQLQTQASEAASKANLDAAAIAKIEIDAKANWANLEKAIADITTMQKNVDGYRAKLKEKTDEFEALHQKIESLLPNATSAGLASAFREQKGRFSKPQVIWLVTFIAAIGCLLAAGFVGLPDVDFNKNWDGILRHFIGRLPLVVPLVWLGVFAGRNYTLAVRVQEEYAFKEAVSTAFEGYKREMSSLGSMSGNSPLLNFCENTLRILARRPGQIYEGKMDDVTPMTPVTQSLTSAAKTLTEAKEAVATVVGSPPKPAPAPAPASPGAAAPTAAA